MDTSDQILCGDGLVILWNLDRPGDSKGVLHHCRGNGDYSLNGNFATFLLVGQLSVASRGRKIRIEIGIAKTPGWRYVKPGIGRWDGNLDLQQP